jgi:hypothetical protein
MRSIKELLQVLVDDSSKLGVYSGICCAIIEAYYIDLILEDEYWALGSFLLNNLPPFTYTCRGYDYAFPYGEIQPRLDWLNEQIKKLEE